MVIALMGGTDAQAPATAREAEEAEEDRNRSISARAGVADGR